MKYGREREREREGEGETDRARERDREMGRERQRDRGSERERAFDETLNALISNVFLSRCRTVETLKSLNHHHYQGTDEGHKNTNNMDKEETEETTSSKTTGEFLKTVIC